MKSNLIVLLGLVWSFNCLQGQNSETHSEIEREKKMFYGVFGINKILNSVSEGNGWNIGMNTISAKGWGVGVSLVRSSYIPEQAIGIPPIDQVENFTGDELSSDIQKNFYDTNENWLLSFSPNIIKSFRLKSTDVVSFYVQAGPSIIFSKELRYQIIYSNSGGSFGGFFGTSGPRLDYNVDKKEYTHLVGGFSRIAMQIGLGRRLGMELSAYGNVNRVKSISEFQIGLVWGRYR